MVETMDKTELEKAKADVRITQLEIDTKIIRSDISTIKNNHLAHMAQDIDRIEQKVDKLDTRLWIVLSSIIILAASNVIVTLFT
jgi:ubiquinone biosynthesis protein UbiJ